MKRLNKKTFLKHKYVNADKDEITSKRSVNEILAFDETARA